MPDFFVPVAPKNYRDSYGSLEVTGDVYRICDRIAELSPNLMVRDKGPAANGHRYVVTEIGVDGTERYVTAVDQLDGRVVQHLEHMLHVPFEHRLAETERDMERRAAQRKEAELDRLVEKVGLPMLPDLEKTGFIQRPVSYPKQGIAGPKRGVGRA